MKQTLDTREIMTGTDGCLFFEKDGVNVPMLELANFAVNMEVAATQRQFVGDPVNKSIPTGVSFTLSITESVVRDDLIMTDLLDSIKNGKFPVFNFQGKTEKPDGQEQRIAFNNAVPSGNFGIMNVTPGELIDREMNFALNTVPEYISALAATYM